MYIHHLQGVMLLQICVTTNRECWWEPVYLQWGWPLVNAQFYQISLKPSGLPSAIIMNDLTSVIYGTYSTEYE